MFNSTVSNLSISGLAMSIAEKHVNRCASAGVEAHHRDVDSPVMFPGEELDQAIETEGLENSREDLMEMISAAIADLLAADAAERAAYTAQLRSEANAYDDAERAEYEATRAELDAQASK